MKRKWRTGYVWDTQNSVDSYDGSPNSPIYGRPVRLKWPVQFRIEREGDVLLGEMVRYRLTVRVTPVDGEEFYICVADTDLRHAIDQFRRMRWVSHSLSQIRADLMSGTSHRYGRG